MIISIRPTNTCSSSVFHMIPDKKEKHNIQFHVKEMADEPSRVAPDPNFDNMPDGHECCKCSIVHILSITNKNHNEIANTTAPVWKHSADKKPLSRTTTFK